MKLQRYRTALALLLLLPLPGAGAGATLYRCVSGNGDVAILQQPCPAGWQQSWRREVAPEPVAAPAAPPEVPARDSTAGTGLPAARAPGPRARPVSERGQRRRRCAAARANARRQRDTRWLHLSFDDRRRLDDRIWRECR